MMKFGLMFAVLLLPVALPAPAQAQIYYPWCANYGGMGDGGGTNCGFSTLEQCRATISGVGGFCQQNPFYYERAAQPKRPRKRHRD
jgi:Protein of unknown function (DUF3551)